MKYLKRLVMIVLILGLLEAALLAAVVINPEIERKVRNVGNDTAEAWMGDEETGGILSEYGEIANNALVDLILPLWSAPKPVDQDESFAGCLACHDAYWEQPRFGALYFDHPLHGELDINCGACHTDTTHPSPPSPTMDTCETCHTEVDSPGQCQLCHAPGELAHFELMGVPSDGFDGCVACHQPGSLATSGGDHLIDHGVFNGSEADECTACHATDFCSSCHEVDHENGWYFSHGQAVYDDGMEVCLTCHSSVSCGACHEGERRLPLPVEWPSG